MYAKDKSSSANDSSAHYGGHAHGCAGLRPAGHRAVPGSPSAIETIDGRYLPNSPAKFGGEIDVNATQSKPHWPARVVPPKGAPNILLIMTEAIRAGT